MSEPPLITVAEIGARRESLGLTKAAAARRAGICRSSWHEIEDGDRANLQPHTRHGIERALECSLTSTRPRFVVEPSSNTDNPAADLIEDIAAALSRYAKRLR